MCVPQPLQWKFRRMVWIVASLFNLFALATSILFLLYFRTRSSTSSLAIILFTLVVIAELGNRFLTILLAFSYCAKRKHLPKCVVGRDGRERYPPTWGWVATGVTVLGGPPAAYLWFEWGDRRGPKRGFIRQNRIIIRTCTAILRLLFITAFSVSLNKNLDRTDVIRIAIAVFAVLICSFLAAADLFSLLLLLINIRTGIQIPDDDNEAEITFESLRVSTPVPALVTIDHAEDFAWNVLGKRGESPSEQRRRSQVSVSSASGSEGGHPSPRPPPQVFVSNSGALHGGWTAVPDRSRSASPASRRSNSSSRVVAPERSVSPAGRRLNAEVVGALERTVNPFMDVEMGGRLAPQDAHQRGRKGSMR